ncbi:putative disease resistance protein At3g14460 [Hevea brasiliensis]|uniref:putative disease resistance protein At3g14460 n=1 Tax=Hevea brasiliensis TaxID=3981 RepID=UPI0025FF0AC3|nr:putative disease resistance protein At3g14460 [Hevea brasiliensis]
MPALFPKFKQLRVLVLYGYDKRKLPNSIGNLKHLRYLNLRGASIIELPQSVSSLYNLQTLILRDCEDLVELPTNLARLINLCCLDLRGTNLRRMPPQMGNLVKLRTLTNFSLGKWCGSGIKELGKLQHIHGELSIENLQNINPKHVWESKLRNKEQLKTLEFKWGGKSKDAKHAKKTLEQLWPHEKVENLYIVGYDGTIFPYWVGSSSSSLSNLVCLKLSECNNCSCLPPLGQLASLKDLSITGFAKLVSVGFEFYGSCRPPMKPFGSLIILRFERIGQWEEWKSEDGAFPHLEELYVERCPRLIKALPNNLSCLKKLQVVRCKKQLVPSLRVPPTILEMMLEDDSRYVVLKKLPSGLHRMEVMKLDSVNSLLDGLEQAYGLASTLEEIELSWCAIERFPLEIFPNLQRIDISWCKNLKSLSATEEIQEESSSCPNLTELLLKGCSNLKSLPECIGSHPSLVKLEIEYCGELELFPKGGLPSKLESLAIAYCGKLKIKVIEGIDNNYEGDEETLLLLPSTLTRLRIDSLQNLESLNYKGLVHLRELIILCCPNLQSIPYCMQDLLPSLVKLEIHGCPKLEPFLEGGLPSQLKSLEISGGHGAIAGLMKRDFRTLPDNEEESIPEETLLPSSLTNLSISNFDNLKYLELHHLTSLNELSIDDCPNLQCIAKERLPSSLSDLYIGFGCPLLSQRCKEKVGEDWPNISHIPAIRILHSRYLYLSNMMRYY